MTACAQVIVEGWWKLQFLWNWVVDLAD